MFIVLALSTVNVTSLAIIPLLDKFNTLAVEPSPTVTEPFAKFVSVSVVNVVFAPVTLNAFEPVPAVVNFAWFSEPLFITKVPAVLLVSSPN